MSSEPPELPPLLGEDPTVTIEVEVGRQDLLRALATGQLDQGLDFMEAYEDYDELFEWFYENHAAPIEKVEASKASRMIVHNICTALPRTDYVARLDVDEWDDG